MRAPFPGSPKEKRPINKSTVSFVIVFLGMIVWMVMSVRNTINEPLTPVEKARIQSPTLPKPLMPQRNKDDKPINVSEIVVNQMMHGKPLKLEYGGPPEKPKNQILPGSRVPAPATSKKASEEFYPDAQGAK